MRTWKFWSGLKTAMWALPLLVGAGSAHAYAVNINSANPYSFNWSYNTGKGVTITGNGSIAATTYPTNSSILVLDISLKNTTVLPAGTNMALMSFGFGINPNAIAVGFSDSNDGGIDDAVMNTGGNTSIPGLANIEVCAFAGNSCKGGPVHDGIQAGGGSDLFRLYLLGRGAWPTSVTIAPIGFKFQGTVGSFEFTTTSGSSSGTVPEPGSLALLGLGLVGMGFVYRRRKAN